MADKYLNLDLNDVNAGKIAEIISNKTAKKILSLIAEKENEFTESDIASELKIPLNTVDYNIKKLLGAGLIEKANNFFWSVKGKKIHTFKLANKKIIISTKSKFSGIIPSMLIFGALGFAANIVANIFRTSKNIYFNNGLLNLANNKVSDESLGLIESAPAASDTLGAVTTNADLSFFSLFNNIWIWVIIGVLIGVLGFFVYKKLKGGTNN